jgi:hypothetical protein
MASSCSQRHAVLSLDAGHQSALLDLPAHVGDAQS